MPAVASIDICPDDFLTTLGTETDKFLEMHEFGRWDMRNRLEVKALAAILIDLCFKTGQLVGGRTQIEGDY